MNHRPRSVTIISWIFMVSGSVGLVYHIAEFRGPQPSTYETVWICFVRFLAIVGGAFMFRGSNWARWLSIAWIGCHVVLSAFHSLFELVAHGLLFGAFAYFLFRPQASQYFRSAKAEEAAIMTTDETDLA